ncbi:MAG: hypothetical protein V1834_00265 [Candidatus Micrarchaeota archaeon]
MVCYAVPTAAAILGLTKGKKFIANEKHRSWFNLLFTGGAIFGLVDHLWNGELFLIGPNLASDLLLGVTITLALGLTWLVAVKIDSAATQTATT